MGIVQATGRAMRKSLATQKTAGYVLVPLFLEQVEGETIETAVARAQFDEVWVASRRCKSMMRCWQRLSGTCERSAVGQKGTTR